MQLMRQQLYPSATCEASDSLVASCVTSVAITESCPKSSKMLPSNTTRIWGI
ncbi:hypothetical protein NP493_233g00000 [Ridgeia piscesae]|uniref:Uncharacterized protein n=1 Tax=Ridgeia piscesae TaxID=27915 RepID=A0AAD9NZN6_RIDPI|nr:hypothetical protein NP493_233g00000 [Ridgeia piscesae]